MLEIGERCRSWRSLPKCEYILVYRILTQCRFGTDLELPRNGEPDGNPIMSRDQRGVAISESRFSLPTAPTYRASQSHFSRGRQLVPVATRTRRIGAQRVQPIVDQWWTLSGQRV